LARKTDARMIGLRRGEWGGRREQSHGVNAMTIKRLVVCLDGTWNSEDKSEETTNVVKLLRAVPAVGQDGVHQIVYYGRGVGSRPGEKLPGGFSGKGLNENVLDAYRFIANNYVSGDEIYLFGFSRGAYTARSLGGLIGIAGLLHPVSLGRPLERVMEIRRSDLTLEQQRVQIAQVERLQRTENVPIECIGVWDTVGSLGIPGDWFRSTPFAKRYYFHDVNLGKRVRVALHAVAVDEKRPAFPPTLWERKIGEPAPDGQIVEQVWFAGVHSNIGGSYPDAQLSDISLDWMAKRVSALTGLAFDEDCLKSMLCPDSPSIEGCVAGVGIESRTWMYLPYRPYSNPYLRSIGGVITPPDSRRRSKPATGEAAINEALHISVLERWKLDAVAHDVRTKDGNAKPIPYRPPNLVELVRKVQEGAVSIPVVGWDGEVMAADTVEWPTT
jgi:uncharacterized protein (DUF2235 family)